MGMGFAMFGATVAEKFERIVEVGGGIAQTSTIRWNFSEAVAPNIANHIPILKPLRYSSKWVWGLLCLEQRLPRNSNGQLKLAAESPKLQLSVGISRQPLRQT